MLRDIQSLEYIFGNGANNGTFIYTGFSPAWLMIKCSWFNMKIGYLVDNKRDP